ncbi:arginine decarboxylase [Anaerobacterium chartisolvens]|uniref:Arginine decarboxylase n=1 Tax=Anaerobacterium chartisolvens TaxID=1297424 RepID=A0A369BCV1_9FIRM|nr:aminotransferase class V-fold PLP-dependent enzyme [Anaerobacterium chartisolvens]RCX18277.1 arginine decarboxylase [Anaerobacterium chartisolvens]
MNTPIYNAAMEYSCSDPVPFHMPGHKLGAGLPGGFASNIPLLDLTEIPGTDNLHNASGVILKAQQLAAQAFGADETFFLVNGSTCGIHAIISTVCSEGDKLIVSRDCHKSVLNAMILFGVRPVYMGLEFDRLCGISTAVIPERVEEALRLHPDASGVLITRPNYYGVCSDIEAIASIVHSYGRILAVDEAHGAHLAFAPCLPICAMEAGADICVQSAHKTLPALTQGAYLHVKGGRIDRDRLRFNLGLLQTSSPSYVIMSSLDVAREIMHTGAPHLMEGVADNVGRLHGLINELEGMAFITEDMLEYGKKDPTRIVINMRNLGKTGFETGEILRDSYNIQVEMADFYNIVCIATVSDRWEHYERLYCALKDMNYKFKDLPALADTNITEIIIPPKKMEPAEVMCKKTVRVGLHEAAGKVCACAVTPYPPGVPVICPGEVFVGEAVEYIYNILDSGGIVNGLSEKYEVSVVK